jgi:hypothetical protein
MFRFTKVALATVAAVALAVPVAVAAPAAATKKVAFKASYSGRAVVRVSGEMADLKADGKGSGTAVGKSAIAGKGKGYDHEPCESFFGSSVITASDGSKLNLALRSDGGKACPGANQSRNALSGTVVVKGGTKKFAKARGTLKLAGNYDRGKGLFSITLTGTPTY